MFPFEFYEIFLSNIPTRQLQETAFVIQFNTLRRSLSYKSSPLICSVNQWTGFYRIGTSFMKELNLSEDFRKSLFSICLIVQTTFNYLERLIFKTFILDSVFVYFYDFLCVLLVCLNQLGIPEALKKFCIIIFIIIIIIYHLTFLLLFIIPYKWRYRGFSEKSDHAIIRAPLSKKCTCCPNLIRQSHAND